MRRVKGTAGMSLIECINPPKNKWAVRWDIRNNTDIMENGLAEGGVNYMEEVFLHKPDLAEIKELISEWFNQCISHKILSGFSWNGHPVWLSIENQINYKAVYDLITINGESSLPIKLKFGTDEKPVFYDFFTAEELKNFYTGMVRYIHDNLEKGWADKDSFNYKPYEDLLLQ